jgi:hypothetical protein
MSHQLQLLHAQTLIELLHPQPASDAMVEITGLAPKCIPIKRYFVDTAVAASVGVETNLQGYSVFVSINPRSAMSGFERDVPYVTAFGLDLQPERTSIEEVSKRMTLGGIAPSITATSGHGAHFYVKLSEPVEPIKAKLVWERLCKFTGSDAVFNTNRIFRLTGTVNWKSVPVWCGITGVYPDHVYTLSQVEAGLDRLGAAPARQPKEGIPVPTDPPMDWLDLQRKLHAGVLDIIATGEKNAYSEKQITRSEADWVVVCALVNAGATDEMIHWVYEKNPVGLLKYREAGAHYLNQTIESARRATSVPITNRPVARAVGIPRFTGGAGDPSRTRSANRFYR